MRSETASTTCRKMADEGKYNRGIASKFEGVVVFLTCFLTLICSLTDITPQKKHKKDKNRTEDGDPGMVYITCFVMFIAFSLSSQTLD